MMKRSANPLFLVLASAVSACLGPQPGSSDASSDGAAADAAADAANDSAEPNKDSRVVGQWRQTVALPQYTSATHYYFADDGSLAIGFQRPVMQGATCSGEVRRSGLSWETSGASIVLRGYRSATCAGEIRCSNAAGQSLVEGCASAPNWSAQSDPSTSSYAIADDGSSLTLGEIVLERVR